VTARIQPRSEFGRAVRRHLLVLTTHPWRRFRLIRPCCEVHAWAVEVGPLIMRWER
jgi:hypothetical protein